MWALDEEMQDSATPAELEAAAEKGCASLLHLVQALARGRRQPTAGTWILTRSAQAVGGEEVLAPAQAALWGLGRVVAREHPELHCRLLDLDPARPDDEVEHLLDMLAADDPEDQLALRGSRRHVLRLGRWPEPDRLIPPAGDCRLHQEQPGSVDGLRLKELSPRPPQTGEIQLRVRAAGMNFREVLNVLGLYSGQAELLGECAGEVTAIGPGVTGWQVGDAAFGLALGAIASTVSTSASMLAAKPAGLTFSQAAAAPVAFITAALAWERARLRPGDRVLIHAAAGGVGLAAVQLARQKGAEVFATASVGKHDYLRTLGVRHVFDSRSLDFAAGILAATGGRGVDVVLNSLSGGEYIPRTLSALAVGGRFVEIGRRGIWTAA